MKLIDLAEMQKAHERRWLDAMAENETKKAVPWEQQRLDWHFCQHPGHASFYVPTPQGYKPEPAATLEDVITLSEAFPAVPLVKVLDACTSFKPAEGLKASERAEVMNIAPFRLEIDLFQRPEFSIRWFAKVGPGLCDVRIFFELPHDHPIGRYELRWHEFIGGRSVERCEFFPDTKAIGRIYREGDPLAEIQQRIRWASGGPEYPNHFTLYWSPLPGAATATPADLARQIRAALAERI